MAFESYATNLGPGSSGSGVQDIYVYDSQTDTIEWITHTPSGGAANGNSYLPTISADGRYVTFASSATNLGPGGSGGGIKDIYLYDRVTDVMTWITHTPSGGSASANSVNPVISADGSTIAFQSTAKNLGPGGSEYYVSDIYLYNRVTGTLEWITQTTEGKTANGSSMDPTISGDGRYIAFETVATNLGPNPYIKFGTGNNIRDIFVYDQVLGTMTWLINKLPIVKANPAGGYYSMPQIVELKFEGGETGTIYYSTTGTASDYHPYTVPLNISTNTILYFYGVTDDGRSSYTVIEHYIFDSIFPVVWATPGAGVYQDYVDVTLRISETGDIYYTTDGSDPLFGDLYINPLHFTSTTTLRYIGITNTGVSLEGVQVYTIIQPIDALNPSISADGNLIAFERGNNVYVYNMHSGTRTLITQTVTGDPANGSSNNPSISGDGNFIAFETFASNLGPDPDQPYGSNIPGVVFYDGNLRKDIFVYDLANDTMNWVTRTPDNGPANGNSYTPSLNYYGNIISYSSSADNLGPGGTGTYRDIFMEIGELVLNVYPGESIQDAINIESDGGTIIVHGDAGDPAFYIENLVINHPLTITSADDGAVIIEAANAGQPVVFITNGGSGSILDGFIILGGWTGVCLDHTSGNTISNNAIGFNQEGVYITNGSTGNIISNNDIEYNVGNGVDILSNSTGNLIEDNEISNNGVIGVFIRDSNSNTLSGNDIQNNGWAGIALDNADGNQINGFNYISGNQEGINLTNSLNNTITGNDITGNTNIGISLINSSNGNYITNNHGISNNGVLGLFIRNSNSNNISGNYIENNGWLGICLDNADNNNINGSNTIFGNLEGLYLVNGSNGNTISGNKIQYNNDTGVYIESSTGNNITSNTAISHNGVIGIFLRNANSNTISGNTIDANSWVGIALDNADSNNINGRNTISGSAMGIYITNTSNLNTVTLNNIQNNLVAGLVLDHATNTKVYSNNFYYNPIQAQADNGSGNAFYRLSSGNYWSDWPSTVQRPIAGNEGLYDRYPKTTPF
ncbi:MAG: right-handed parallel beta-helix repeat-containing protein [Methanobacterium sp.]|nr:right-handed parallel beta-helix repeat-containing protein [Methanobacterium sp.]